MNHEEIGLVLERASKGAKSVFLICPFIKNDVLCRLLNFAIEELTVVTRWRIEELASGVSDLEVFNSVRNFGGKLYLLNNLHAKYFRFSDQAFFGSANLTNSGLGSRSFQYVELLSDATVPNLDFESFVLDRATQATERDYLRNLALVKALGSEAFVKLEEESILLSDEADWLPSSRRPEQLFHFYKGQIDGMTKSGRQSAESDLKAMQIPLGLEKKYFDILVQSRMDSAKVFREVDDFVAIQSRRFGEMSQLLKSREEGISHKSAQYAWQIIFRWLLEFKGDRYEKSRNPYSEIVSIREPRS